MLSKLAVETFLKNQTQLFDEPVAETPEEAEEFLEDCMAEVLPDIKSVRRWLDEGGMDVSGLSDRDLLDAEEVFPPPDGTYLLVEA